MVLRSVILLGLLTLSTLLIGCVKPVTLHLIDQQDIIAVNEGGTYKAPRDGYFVSEYYVDKIMQARVK